MNTLTQTTAENLTGWLEAEGFRDTTSDTPWFRKGRVAVTIDGADVGIYVFDRPQDAVKLRWATWDIKLAGAPLGVTAATIRTALSAVRAAMLPTD